MATVVSGIPISQIPQVSAVNPDDLLLLTTSGLSRSVEVSLFVNDIAALVSGDISAIISASIESEVSAFTDQITYISAQVSANTEAINVISAAVSGISGVTAGDSTPIAFDPNIYTQTDNTISGHYDGIDNALEVLSATISGLALSAGLQEDHVEYHLITVGEELAGSFSLTKTPISSDTVKAWVFGGMVLANLENVPAGQTPDFEVVGTTFKFNSNSSPTSALNEIVEAGEVILLNFAVLP
jgi:hypothetical protein